MFGVWVRDGHHAGPDAGDAYGNSGSYFQILAAGSAGAGEQKIALVASDTIGLLGLLVVVTGLCAGKSMHTIRPAIRRRDLSLNGRTFWRVLGLHLGTRQAARRFL